MAEAVATGVTKRDRLAQRRKALGLTQEALAGLLGVERSTVVRWERGETEPAPWIQPRLAKALRVSADRLQELLVSDGGSRPALSHGAAEVPRQLPATVADFTGRNAEIETLTRMLDDAGAGTPGAVVISAIGGTAGVGKTALALYWAHRVATRFSDGQLYVNLRGFDPSGAPATSAEAVRGFLEAFGVPPERIPPGLDAQAASYRSLLADKKMLIVLDNARDEQQVRPLLPASPASLVLVTSRNQLTGLAAADGARLLTLDVLTKDEAVQLLTVRIGHDKAAAEPSAVAAIADLCARLPLALAIAAARAATQPGFPMTALAAELRDAAGRLDALDAGDPAASVRAVFSWSYSQLSEESARMFRLLGLHPGPDITIAAAASLAVTDVAGARQLLGELCRAHLISEHVPGRYALHDLLRAYAAETRDRDTVNDRTSATARLLDHYLHTAAEGSRLLSPTREPITVAPPSPGAVPEPLADYQQALTWFEAEHDVLLATTAQAAGSRFDRHVWQLAWALMPFLSTRGHYQELIGVQRMALAAATRVRDVAGQAIASRLLATAYVRAGEYEKADAQVRHSMELCRQLGNQRDEANALVLLAHIARADARYADAIGHCELALGLFRAIGYTAGEAVNLNNIGWYYALLGDYQQARVFCQRSLTLSVEIGHRINQGHAWDSLGYAEQHLGNFSEAAACYERALSIFLEFGDRFEEARTLSNLGDACHSAGDVPRAQEVWEQALAILRDLDHPDADEVRAKLVGADG